MQIYYTKNEDSASELVHYGVPGMKWGVRRDRAREKANKYQAKSDKYLDKGMNRKYLTDIGYTMRKNELMKARKYGKKAAKYNKKADKYQRNIDKDVAKEKQTLIEAANRVTAKASKGTTQGVSNVVGKKKLTAAYHIVDDAGKVKLSYMMGEYGAVTIAAGKDYVDKHIDLTKHFRDISNLNIEYDIYD